MTRVRALTGYNHTHTQSTCRRSRCARGDQSTLVSCRNQHRRIIDRIDETARPVRHADVQVDDVVLVAPEEVVVGSRLVQPPRAAVLSRRVGVGTRVDVTGDALRFVVTKIEHASVRNDTARCELTSHVTCMTTSSTPPPSTAFTNTRTHVITQLEALTN